MFWMIVIGFIVALIVSKKARGMVLGLAIGGVVLFYLLRFIVNNFELCLKVAGWGFLIMMVLGFFLSRSENKKTKIAFEKWLAQPVDFDNIPLRQIIERSGLQLCAASEKPVFLEDDIPLGRMNAFLSHFDGRNIYDEEVIGFSPVRSLDQIELREYGFAVTDRGVYVSHQKKDGDKHVAKNIELPYSGVFAAEKTDDRITLKYPELKEIVVRKEDVSFPLDLLHAFFRELIDSKVSLALHKRGLLKPSDNPGTHTEYEYVNDEARQRVIVTAGTAASMPVGNLNMDENGFSKFHNTSRGGGSSGHGFAAEYANTTFDRATGHSAQTIGGDNKLNGADRVVDGRNVQTKYCATNNMKDIYHDNAAKSIGDCFENGHARYLNDDGSMMQIEVPRNQYDSAVKHMKKRIANGEVPGESNPENAKNYIRKGYCTYNQALAIAKAGTLEGVAVDAVSGAIISTVPGGCTFAISFALTLWNGGSLKDATKVGLINGAKTVGMGTLVYTLTAQLSRQNTILGKSLTASAGEKIASGIRGSMAAKGAIGKQLGLGQLTARQVIGSGVLAIVTFGPDIARGLVGRISPAQLLKNSAVGASGIAGAALGQALIPIPVVGAMVGGLFSGLIAKKVLDHYIEDDAIEMFNVLKEEFLDQVALHAFSKTEFQEIMDLVFPAKQLPHMMRNMYQSGVPRECAKKEIVLVAITTVLSKRRKITTEDFNTAYEGMVA